MRSHLVVWSACLVMATACGGSPSSPTADGGRLMLRLTDTPFEDARAVLVTFSQVTAHRADSDWTAVPFADGAASRTCDLKRLEGPQDVLGTGPLPAARYTMVRLVVSSAALYFDSPTPPGSACAAAIAAPPGRSAPVVIPSGEVKLNRGFDIPEIGTTTMLLDFDGDRSIIETGNGRFMMKPVVTVVSVQ